MKPDRHTVVRDRRGHGAPADVRDRVPTSRVPDDTLLDAARTCVLSTGVRRTTLTEIARTAGVSRMTLYRRFPDVRSILTALMTREFGALLRDVSVAAETAPGDPAHNAAGSASGASPGTGGGTGDARRRLVDIGVASVRALTADPLMRAVLDMDAELLLPYITQQFGTTQRLAEQVVRTLIIEGHADGSIRRGVPHAQVRAVLLVVQSFVLSHRPATADVPEEALFDELHHLLDSTLAAW